MKRLSLFLIGPLTGVLAISVCPAIAQDQIPWVANLGSYSDTDNWDHPFGDLLPEALFDEIALIGNGGTAFVDDTPNPSPAGLIINAGSTLEIRSGGNLMVLVGDLGVAMGNAAVNNGRLVGLSGGSFTAQSLSSGGAGTIDLSGTASVTINGASTLSGTTRIAGPNVSFSTASLTSIGTISPVLTGDSHSAINVSGQATLGGTLAIDVQGAAMSFGSTWDIVNAQSIVGSFTNVTSDVSPGPGLVLAAQVVPGGNGQIARVAVESRLTLQVNRRTGQVQIRDLAGVQTTTIDGYSIGSPGGTFDPSNWNPFGLANWVPSDAHATHVGEITLTGQREIAANQSVDLGSFYANPARTSMFGVAQDDAIFQYSLKSGEVLTGLVDFTDAHNNVVLVVDPQSGDAWIQNQSVFDIHIDGYDIASDSGALAPNEWVSFASSDNSWTEANPADYHIGELNLANSRLLGGESAAISLGQIFTPGSERDLAFTFNTAPVGGSPAMTFTGVVEYDDGPIDFGPGVVGIPGDYNNSGQVEQGDLDLVLLNWGLATPPIPPGWTNDLPMGAIDQEELDKVLLNWGNTAALRLSAAAVPEPAGCVLALVCLSWLAVKVPRRAWPSRVA